MPCLAQQIEPGLSSRAQQRQLFFSTLLHDDRQSYYFISSIHQGLWTERPIKAAALHGLHFTDADDFYLSHNGFTQRQRKLEQTRQLNALFFDIDCHGSSRRQDIDAAIAKGMDSLNAAISHGTLPQPTMIVNSGRGLHLYYVLQRSVPYRFAKGQVNLNEKGIKLFRLVQGQLGNLLESILQDIPLLSVDRAVFDHTRVSRVPGTFNSKAGCFASLASCTGQYHSLASLSCYRPARSTAAPSKRGTIIKFEPLMISRFRKLHELQEYRNFDCQGSRELMSFLVYNSAVQIFPRDDARGKLIDFNNRFTNPLPTAELDKIIDSVDTVTNVKGEKGYYLIKAPSLINMINLTEKEMADLNFFASKRTIERLQAKENTARARQSRNQQIIALYASGTLTQAQVAQCVGCSARTVQSVLRQRPKAKPAKQAARTPLLRTAACSLRQPRLTVQPKALPAPMPKPQTQATPEPSLFSNRLAKNCHTSTWSVVPIALASSSLLKRRCLTPLHGNFSASSGPLLE